MVTVTRQRRAALPVALRELASTGCVATSTGKLTLQGSGKSAKSEFAVWKSINSDFQQWCQDKREDWASASFNLANADSASLIWVRDFFLEQVRSADGDIYKDCIDSWKSRLDSDPSEAAIAKGLWAWPWWTLAMRHVPLPLAMAEDHGQLPWQ